MLDKDRTPLMKFPPGATVAYHRPKSASAKKLMADELPNLMADFHDEAVKLVQQKPNAPKAPVACHVYQKCTELAWESLSPESKKKYESDAVKKRNEPENFEDKMGFLHLLKPSAQMFLWSSQERCPEGWSFSLITAGPDPKDPKGQIISWSLDMPPLGADGQFMAYKAAGFDWDRNVGVPFTSYNVEAQMFSEEQRKKEGLGEFAGAGKIHSGRPRIPSCDEDWKVDRIRLELRRYIDALYVYSCTPVMVEAKERLNWEALFADPSAYLTPSSIPEGLTLVPFEAMKLTDAFKLHAHIEASDEAEEPFFGFIFKKEANAQARASSAGLGEGGGDKGRGVTDKGQEGSDGEEVIDIDMGLEDSDGEGAEGGGAGKKGPATKGQRGSSKKMATKPAPTPAPKKASKKVEKAAEKSEEANVEEGEEDEEEPPAKAKRGATTKAMESQAAKKSAKKTKATKALDEEAVEAAEEREDEEEEAPPAKPKQGGKAQPKKSGPAAKKAPPAKAAPKNKPEEPEGGDEEGEDEEGEDEEELPAKPKRGRKRQTTKPGPAAAKGAAPMNPKTGKRKAAALASNGEEDAEQAVERPPAKKRAGKEAVVEGPVPEPVKPKVRRAPAKAKASTAKHMPEPEQGVTKFGCAIKPPICPDATPKPKEKEGGNA
ncbi:hypothetical protein BOTBODRAFT_179908 [Botryobasidium botryosum FD-172 SS1]|uniref:Uncharacterized protein n=1 Tax=Botryobasidium botryosum (strain FD-172 SS1) TaxID=930990 RepID=A0A067M993_BOTB1|nr:hypothetical protein BOTBODRAFT_179908 [Botryobasidium botryosum FD-172 SS1]